MQSMILTSIAAFTVAFVGHVMPTQAAEPLPLSLKLEFITIEGQGQASRLRDAGDHISLKSGDDVTLKLTYTNLSASPVTMMTCLWGWVEDEGGMATKENDRIFFFAEDGKATPKLQAKRGVKSECNSGIDELAPGEKREVLAYHLNSTFDVSKTGKYQVVARRILETPTGDLWGDTEEQRELISASLHPKIVSNSIVLDVTK